MRFNSIRIRDIGTFKDVALDLDGIPGTIVGVTGANGAGKSTLLELMAAGLYRTCPTRGSLADLATSRNSLLEVGFTNGASHTFRHVVDSVSGKGESVVLDGAGNAVTASAKLTEFRAWAAQHLPPAELLYSSTFAAQGSGGFLELKAGERKSVLLKVLGIDRFEGMAEKARENVRATKLELATAAARLEDERARVGNVSDSETALKERELTLERAKQGLADAESNVKALRLEAETVRAEIAAAQSIAEQRVDLLDRAAKARATVADRDDRIRNNMALVDRGKDIQRAAARSVELEGAILEAEALVDRARQAADAARAEHRTAETKVQAEEALLRTATADLQRAETGLRDAPAVAAAVEAHPAAVEAHKAAADALAAAEHELDTIREARVVGADSRIAVLREGLHFVRAATTVEDSHRVATDTLGADDKVVAEASTLPARLAAAQGMVADARGVAVDAAETERSLRQLTQRADEMDAARGARSAAETAVARHSEQLVVLRGASSNAAAVVTQRDAASMSSADSLASLRGEREALKADAGRLPKLQDAESRIKELNAERTHVQGELREMEAKLAALPSPVERAVPDCDGAERAVTTAREAVTEIEVAIRVGRERLESVRVSQGKVAELEKARAAAEEELSEWVQMSQDLGPDGLQALEIDAAGPKLTAMVNDLLHSCVGPRWTVTIETQRSSADGKKTIEGCDVRVLDTLAGREGTVETFSGGERVLIGEAVSLALSMLACGPGGAQGASLVRDESGAALDGENAVAYIAMLRRAAQKSGASKVFFVSHDPATWELADARIHVADGKVTVQ